MGSTETVSAQMPGRQKSVRMNQEAVYSPPTSHLAILLRAGRLLTHQGLRPRYPRRYKTRTKFSFWGR